MWEGNNINWCEKYTMSTYQGTTISRIKIGDFDFMISCFRENNDFVSSCFREVTNTIWVRIFVVRWYRQSNIQPKFQKYYILILGYQSNSSRRLKQKSIFSQNCNIVSFSNLLKIYLSYNVGLKSETVFIDLWDRNNIYLCTQLYNKYKHSNIQSKFRNIKKF